MWGLGALQAIARARGHRVVTLTSLAVTTARKSATLMYVARPNGRFRANDKRPLAPPRRMGEDSSIVASALCIFGILLVGAGLVMVTNASPQADEVECSGAWLFSSCSWTGERAYVAMLGGWGVALTGFVMLGAGLVLLAASGRTAA